MRTLTFVAALVVAVPVGVACSADAGATAGLGGLVTPLASALVVGGAANVQPFGHSLSVADKAGWKPAKPLLIGIDDHGPAGRARVEELRKATLQPVTDTETLLPDAATEALLGPAGVNLAVGGENGGAYLVDLDRLGRSTPVRKIYRAQPRYLTTTLVAWPRAHQLIAVDEGSYPHASNPATLVLIDPARRYRPQRIHLHRALFDSCVTGNGTAILLLGPRHLDRVGPAHLLVISPSGRRRAVDVPSAPTGFSDPGTAGNSFDDEPGMTVRGRSVLLASGSTVTSVGLRRLHPVIHRMPGLLHAHVSDGTQRLLGSAGALAQHERNIALLRSGQLLVSGNDTRPVHHGEWLHSVARRPVIITSHGWKPVTTLSHLIDPQVTGRSILGTWTAAGARAHGLAADRLNGHPLFHRPLNTQRYWWWWTDHRLTLYPINGDIRGRIRLLDPTTGRTTRSVPRPGNFPFSLFTWTPGQRTSEQAIDGAPF